MNYFHFGAVIYLKKSWHFLNIFFLIVYLTKNIFESFFIGFFCEFDLRLIRGYIYETFHLKIILLFWKLKVFIHGTQTARKKGVLNKQHPQDIK